MRKLLGKAMCFVAPVFGFWISVPVLRAAHFPFPPALSLGAWTDWVVLCAVFYTFAEFCIFVTGRIFGGAPAARPDSARPAA